MYLYMSDVPGVYDANRQEVVSLPSSAKFRCRGEVTAKDDPQGFKRLMAAEGHSVVLADTMVGTPSEGTVVATATELGVGHLTGEA